MLREFIDFIRFEKKYGWGVLLGDFLRLNKLYLKDYYLERVLKYAKQKNVKFTFFFSAKNIRSKKRLKLIRRIARQGHEIGSHAYNHLLFGKRTKKEVLEDFQKADAVFKDLGIAIKGFRPPFLSFNNNVIRAAKKFNYSYISAYCNKNQLSYAKKVGIKFLPVIQPYDWEGLFVQKKDIQQLIKIWRKAKGTLLLHPWIFSKHLNKLDGIIKPNQDYTCKSNLINNKLSISFDVF